MFTRIAPIEEIYKLVTETILANSSNLSEISDNGNLSGISHGISKTHQKALKEVALVEAHLFPDDASGAQLDEIAQDRGIPGRFQSSKSSTYIFLVADPGTQYTAGTHKVKGVNGLQFDFENNFTMGVLGYSYVKLSSVDLGEKTNVGPLTLNQINPVPAGHKFLINEFMATGGRDVESDFLFRQRIKEYPNILAQDTISYLEQHALDINNNILRIFHQGIDTIGKIVLAVATQNGVNLNTSEIDALTNHLGPKLSLSEISGFGVNIFNIKIENVQYHPIDFDFRVLIDGSFDVDLVRAKMQSKLQRSLDFKEWKEGTIINWDDLLSIVKSISGVIAVPDEHFNPNIDISVPINKLPRVRSFVMRDLDGILIQNLSGTLVPTFYPVEENFAFLQTF